MPGATFVADLAVVLCVAALTAVLARRLRQPTVLGYLFAGLIVGPYLPLPIFADPKRTESLAEFGVVLVMFAIGIELRLSRLARVLPVSGLVALVQAGFLAWCGFTLGDALGWGRVEAVFLGASLAISSTMVVTKVFEQIEVEHELREQVLGILVVQDLLAVFLIAAMTAVAAGEGLGAGDMARALARLAGFLLAATVGGLLVVPRLLRAVARLRSREILVLVGTGLAFGMALFAKELGYSLALGAFLAGMLVAESGRARQLELLVQPLRDVFAAVFFVSVGMSVDPRLALQHAPATALVFATVVLGQLASVSTAGVLSGLGLRRSVTAGLALGQIGEFSFIIASIGAAAGIVRPELSPILVTVAVMTSFTTPLLLRASDRVVHAIDKRLPARVQHLLALYEAWLGRFRAGEGGVLGGAREGSPVRRATRALALDAGLLLAFLALCVAWLPELVPWFGERTGLPRSGSRALVAVALLALGLPLALGLTRNTLALAGYLGTYVLARTRATPPAARLAAHTARLMVVLAVMLAVGMPSIAVLRPLTGAAYGMALLAVASAGIALHVWRSAGAMEAELRSGAETLAAALARRSAAREPHGGEPGLFPGLEAARSFPLRGAAVGRTLAELDLRARTGATVVAIQRAGEKVLLPTGRERLEAGDVLGLVGSSESVARAQDLLADGAL